MTAPNLCESVLMDSKPAPSGTGVRGELLHPLCHCHCPTVSAWQYPTALPSLSAKNLDGCPACMPREDVASPVTAHRTSHQPHPCKPFENRDPACLSAMWHSRNELANVVNDMARKPNSVDLSRPPRGAVPARVTVLVELPSLANSSCRHPLYRLTQGIDGDTYVPVVGRPSDRNGHDRHRLCLGASHPFFPSINLCRLFHLAVPWASSLRDLRRIAPM